MVTENFKISIFQTKLLLWFGEHQRQFPWRDNNVTDYQIIISEILLQRTKAETVSSFYNKFIKDFPNWHNLASTKLEAIESYLKPIGLSKQRAKRLQDLAMYMEANSSVIPENSLELRKIPFMGQYIANSVELQIFNRKMPLLDVNMARVLERYFGPRRLKDIRYDPYLQNLAFNVVNIERSKAMNWAMLDFAAAICKARNPLCLNCPLSYLCLYFQTILVIEKEDL